jgi:hypothetical protein
MEKAAAEFGAISGAVFFINHFKDFPDSRQKHSFVHARHTRGAVSDAGDTFTLFAKASRNCRG